MATAGTNCIFISKRTIHSGRSLINWLLNFAKWWLADGGFYQPHAHVVRNQTTECRDFCRCVKIYIRMHRQTGVRMHVSTLSILSISCWHGHAECWAVTVWDRNGADGFECASKYYVHASTLSVWAHAVPLDHQWGHPCLYSQGSGSQSLKSGQLLVTALHKGKEREKN